MEYGEITFKSVLGSYDKYMFSNAKVAEEVFSALKAFKELL